MKFIVFFEGLEGCGKKDSTTSLNVGEQFLDEGFYEIY
jgi:thymidylate kinase